MNSSALTISSLDIWEVLVLIVNKGSKGKKSNICFIRSILHLEIWYAVYLKLWMTETAMVKQCKMYA